MAVEEKKNVLFVCSCLQSDLLLQQSIVLVSELISNLYENCNVFVLTNTDTLKLVLADDVKFYVEKITEKGILEIVRKEKITQIFPILSDTKIEKMMRKILQEKRNKKLKIFHSDYLLSKHSKSSFKALAKKAGFTINNKKELDDLKNTQQFCAVCIKDKCKNQIVLDIFEQAIVNSKKLFCAPVLGQTLARKREISHFRPFKLLSNDKCNVIIGSLASLIEGGLMPTTGWVLSKAIIALSANVQTERDTIMDDGLKWALWFLVIAFGNGLMVFFKLWKLETLGSVITNSLRKKIIEKYLQIHIGFFDEDENSPGALLTKLSLDTTQLNSIILTFNRIMFYSIYSFFISYSKKFNNWSY